MFRPLSQPSETRVAPERVASSLHRFIAADSNPSAVATLVASCSTCWWLWAIEPRLLGSSCGA